MQYVVGREFVDACADELQTSPVAFVDGVYSEIDASVWCRRVLEAFDKYLAEKTDESGAVKGAEKPPEWDKFLFSQCEQAMHSHHR